MLRFLLLLVNKLISFDVNWWDIGYWDFRDFDFDKNDDDKSEGKVVVEMAIPFSFSIIIMLLIVDNIEENGDDDDNNDDDDGKGDESEVARTIELKEIENNMKQKII